MEKLRPHRLPLYLGDGRGKAARLLCNLSGWRRRDDRPLRRWHWRGRHSGLDRSFLLSLFEEHLILRHGDHSPVSLITKLTVGHMLLQLVPRLVGILELLLRRCSQMRL